jgi:hypothetical protein
VLPPDCAQRRRLGANRVAVGEDHNSLMVRSMPDTGKVSGFFAVDRRTWARVRALGLNCAVAYLVLARGTGKNNRETAWSVDAIERYTGIARSRARHAIRSLLDTGVARQIRAGSRPKYDLLPWRLVRGNDPRKPLGFYEQKVFEKVARGEEISAGKEQQLAARAVARGWLLGDGNGRYTVAPPPKAEPNWIWLPNELVTGAAGETPPIELVRQIQDVMTLRLFIDLYHAQNLRDNGGIDREIIWRSYERVKVGQRGQYTIWGFDRAETYAECVGPAACHWRDELTDDEMNAGESDAVDFFRRLDRLLDLGLLEWVPHLVESDEPDAGIIHAYGLAGSDSSEDRIGFAANVAGLVMLNEDQRAYAERKGLELVPVLRHLANLQMIRIARRRYRPHTKLTAAWWRDLNTTGEEYLKQYKALARAAR